MPSENQCHLKIGSSLLGRTCEFWKAKLEKVQEISDNDIQEILKLSYDELDDETEKAIFLDIAFFFVGKDKDEAVNVFKSCDFFPEVGIAILLDKCLLTIDLDNKFEMHSLIQDMGRKLGKSTRLFLRENAWKDLQNVEPIKQLNNLGCLYLRKCRDLKRLPEQLGDMKALKKIDASDTAIEKLPDSITHLKELASYIYKWVMSKLAEMENTANLTNREVAEWFNHKSSGCTASFDIPPSFGSNFLGIALWIVYACKASEEKWTSMRAVITNDTEGITENYPIYVNTVVGEARSKVNCSTGEKISVKSGDRIKVSFPSLLYSDEYDKVPTGQVKVKMRGVHLIPSPLQFTFKRGFA